MVSSEKAVHSKVVEQATKEALLRRGVKLQDVADIVYEMQMPYNKDLTMDYCLESVEKVLKKRELQHAILVGIELDELRGTKKIIRSRCNKLLNRTRAYLA